MLLRMSSKYNGDLEKDQLLYTAGTHTHSEHIYTHTIHTNTIHTQNTHIIVLYFTLLPFSDTVSRPGIYCVVSNAIEQCKAEGVVDVFQATKAVRLHKPGAVTTLVSMHLFIADESI